jgi:hypothetical protein
MAKTAKTQVEQIADEAQKTMNENVEKMTRGMEEAAQFGQENVDAVVASSKIAAKAAENLGAEIMAYTKKSYEDGLAAAKDLTTSKSVSELIEKQDEQDDRRGQAIEPWARSDLGRVLAAPEGVRRGGGGDPSTHDDDEEREDAHTRAGTRRREAAAREDRFELHGEVRRRKPHQSDREDIVAALPLAQDRGCDRQREGG